MKLASPTRGGVARWRWLFAICGWLISLPAFGAAADPLYFAFQDVNDFPTTPANIRIFAPGFIDVPAGAVLRVHLLRGETLVATSLLRFPTAFNTGLGGQPIPYPAADFYPLNAANTTGISLGQSEISGGKTDLLPVVQAPTQYRFLWDLSAGVMGTPGRVVITSERGSAVVKFTDLKLCAVSAASANDSQKPGSVLFFNRYTSSASNRQREDTVLNLTNANPGASAFVRMFLVSSATCEVAEVSFCLAAQQTVSLRMSDIDPGSKGYLVALASDANGRPVQFNWLIGNAVLKSGAVTAVLAAYSVAKRSDGAVAPDGNNLSELIFDNVNYDRLPAQIAFDSVASQVNGLNATQLSLYRPMPNLAGSVVGGVVQLTGFGLGAQNQTVTTTGTLALSCYTEANVSALRLAPITISNLIQPGSTAWLTAATSDLQPLLGTQINSGEFNQGMPARALTFATEYRIKVPVRLVSCPQ